MTALSTLTSMRVGGTPAGITECRTREELIASAKELWSTGDDWIVVGGGTNLVFAEDVSNLNVLLVKTTGIEKTKLDGKQVWKIQAGVGWDELVAEAVSEGLAGIEGMSGIPGTCGASPVQNIGAYGQELSDVFLRAEFLDYETGELVILGPKDLKFGYRDSAIKRGRSGIITWIELELIDLDGMSRPLYSGQIAGALNSQMGEHVKLTDVRDAVLKLRAAKGMVLDPKDPNSVSCGSFFTNPIVSDSFARTIPDDCQKWESQEDDGLSVKLSAAWLIEDAGIGKGFSLPGSNAAISSKHALAIVNRGGATGEQIAELARFIQERVAAKFGINLVPEPNLIGFKS
jgi:UDP-N-acetylmuramate dehydrogenase